MEAAPVPPAAGSARTSTPCTGSGSAPVVRSSTGGRWRWAVVGRGQVYRYEHMSDVDGTVINFSDDLLYEGPSHR